MDIFSELKKDHREVKAMLRELVWLDKDDDYRFLLLAEIKNALVSHSRAEESVFYNSLRKKNPDAAARVLKSAREHIEVETLLWALFATDRVGANWKPLARKLKDRVDHHVSDEELRLFALGRKYFTSSECVEMGEKFRRIKPKMQEQSELRATFETMLYMVSPRLAMNLIFMG